jgi:hypothetical protein
MPQVREKDLRGVRRVRRNEGKTIERLEERVTDRRGGED